MTTQELALYFGLALVYALLATSLLWIGFRLARRPLSRPALRAILLVAFFVILTHHPLPDPAQLDCSDGGVRPILEPFRFLEGYHRLWRRQAPIDMWLHNLSVVSPLMNLLICAAIGVALAPLLDRAWKALLVGAGMSGLVELSQLTGVFGLYPCPWRHFEVDDLILNIGGVMLGYALARAMRRSHTTS